MELTTFASSWGERYMSFSDWLAGLRSEIGVALGRRRTRRRRIVLTAHVVRVHRSRWSSVGRFETWMAVLVFSNATMKGVPSSEYSLRLMSMS